MQFIDYARTASVFARSGAPGPRAIARGGRRSLLGAVLIVAALGNFAAGADPTLVDDEGAGHAVADAFRTDGPLPRAALAFRSSTEPPSAEDAAASLAGHLDVNALLAPGGIERPHWRSFAHVDPVPATLDEEGTRFVVAIDPGHGGSDPGAEGPNGLLEKHLTLDIARRVRLFLSELDDIEVVLTRERDRGLSRGARVRRVRSSEADLFVSLHFNHLPQSGVTLVESFYAAPENIAESRALQRARNANGSLNHVAGEPHDDTFTRGSARFATFVQRRVFDEVGRHNARALDAGVKTDTLFVLTRSYTSGALVELTCLSNADEAERLTDESYRDNLAAGLADAIREYRESLETRPLDGTDA